MRIKYNNVVQHNKKDVSSDKKSTKESKFYFYPDQTGKLHRNWLSSTEYLNYLDEMDIY